MTAGKAETTDPKKISLELSQPILGNHHENPLLVLNTFWLISSIKEHTFINVFLFFFIRLKIKVMHWKTRESQTGDKIKVFRCSITSPFGVVTKIEKEKEKKKPM